MDTPQPPSPLRLARFAAGYTGRAFARELGVSHGHVSRIERGQERPWPGFRRRAAAVLGRSESELFPPVL